MAEKQEEGRLNLAGEKDSHVGDRDSTPSENNIFRIADELVRQIDRTRKLVIVMIVAIVVGIPVSWHAAPLLGTSDNFRIVGYFTIAIAGLFIILGARQWMILSKWTKRYKTYKELQRKVDEKLDF